MTPLAKLTPERQKMVEECIQMGMSRIKKYPTIARRLGYNECRSVVFDALVVAATRWVPGPAKFSTYAFDFVDGYLLAALAKENTKLRRRMKTNCGGLQAAVCVEGEVPILDDDEKQLLLNAVKMLPPRQQEIVFRHYLMEQGSPIIAQQMGIKRSTVTQTVINARANLREALQRDGKVLSRAQPKQ